LASEAWISRIWLSVSTDQNIARKVGVGSIFSMAKPGIEAAGITDNRKFPKEIGAVVFTTAPYPKAPELPVR
jgi:hypothetical protein